MAYTFKAGSKGTVIGKVMRKDKKNLVSMETVSKFSKG